MAWGRDSDLAGGRECVFVAFRFTGREGGQAPDHIQHTVGGRGMIALV